MKDNSMDYIIYKDNLIFVHERNLITKYKNNYRGKAKEIYAFYNNTYCEMREKMLSLIFDGEHEDSFFEAAEIINNYYSECDYFSKENGITSQSKFASTFLEEISSYLFKDIPEIKSGEFGYYNKNIYAGLKLDSNKNISIITKDVDFCIGKKVEVEIKDNSRHNSAASLIVPIVAVEVKTYLDATMFGEIKSSSGAIRSASPNSKTYVLMGYKDLKDEHIVAARQDSVLTEMFVLRAGADEPIDPYALFDYWREITEAVGNVSEGTVIKVPGRLLHADE